MALKIEDIRLMKRYFEGVMSRANHHADNVNEIILALAGGVIWRGADIGVRTYRDKTANMLWMKTDTGKVYCFIFNHNTGKIEVHKDSMNGRLLWEFSNENSLPEVKGIFSNMK